MVLRSLVCLGAGGYIYIHDVGVELEWLIYRINSLNLIFYILLDWISLIFMGLVILISSIIFLYRIIYIKDDQYINRFSILVFIFIITILLIIISPNVFRILFG